jgi:hypothetical protein
LTDIEPAVLNPTDKPNNVFRVRSILAPENFNSEVHGFNNVHHPFDDDVALLMLDSCVPGVKVGASLRLATPGGTGEEECSLVTTVGWGHYEDHGLGGNSVLSAFGKVKTSNVLRKLEKQTLHKRDVCEKAHVASLEWKAKQMLGALKTTITETVRSLGANVSED